MSSGEFNLSYKLCERHPSQNFQDLRSLQPFTDRPRAITLSFNNAKNREPKSHSTVGHSIKTNVFGEWAVTDSLGWREF